MSEPATITMKTTEISLYSDRHSDAELPAMTVTVLDEGGGPYLRLVDANGRECEFDFEEFYAMTEAVLKLHEEHAKELPPVPEWLDNEIRTARQ